MDQSKNEQPTVQNQPQEIVETKLSSEQNFTQEYELASRQPSSKNTYLLIFSLIFLIFLSIISLIFTGVVKL
jgi:hypothetical protein